MYKSFADLESGLDFFQTVSKNRHSRNLPFCFLQTGKTLLFIMLKILPAILRLSIYNHRTTKTNQKYPSVNL